MYAFTDDGKITVLDVNLSKLKQVENIFGNVVDLSVCQECLLIGTQEGKIFTTDFDFIVNYKFQLRKNIFRVFVKNPNDFFITFSTGNSLYLQKNKFLGWKKDLPNCMIL